MDLVNKRGFYDQGLAITMKPRRIQSRGAGKTCFDRGVPVIGQEIVQILAGGNAKGEQQQQQPCRKTSQPLFSFEQPFPYDPLFRQISTVLMRSLKANRSAALVRRISFVTMLQI